MIDALIQLTADCEAFTVCLLRSSEDGFLICHKIICVFLARK